MLVFLSKNLCFSKNTHDIKQYYHSSAVTSYYHEQKGHLAKYYPTHGIDAWYIYIHLVDFYDKLVGKYTSPMDTMGKLLQIVCLVVFLLYPPPSVRKDSTWGRQRRFSRKTSTSCVVVSSVRYHQKFQVHKINGGTEPYKAILGVGFPLHKPYIQLI